MSNLDQLVGAFRQLAGHSSSEQAQRTGDGGKRRPQLMTDGRDELRLHLFHPRSLGDVSGNH